MTKPIVAGRGWYSVSEAARYIGVNPKVIQRAINNNEIPAYLKPATYENATQHLFLKVAKDDLDNWIRATWQPYTP